MAGDKRKRALFKKEYKETRIKRHKRLRATDIHNTLKQIIKEQAEFREMQKAVIRAIITGESPVITMIGTSGGKNLLFMLPAFYNNGGINIVIIPLIVLR
jgi:superfamily II DNA helicase RecQ